MSDPDSDAQKPPQVRTETVAPEEVVAASSEKITPSVLPPPAPAASEIIAAKAPGEFGNPPAGASASKDAPLPSFRPPAPHDAPFAAPVEVVVAAKEPESGSARDERDETLPLEQIVLPSSAPGRSVWKRPASGATQLDLGQASPDQTLLSVPPPEALSPPGETDPDAKTPPPTLAKATATEAEDPTNTLPSSSAAALLALERSAPAPVRSSTPRPSASAASAPARPAPPPAAASAAAPQSATPPPSPPPAAPPRAAGPPRGAPPGSRSSVIGWVILSLVMGMVMGGACVTCSPHSDVDDEAPFAGGPHVGVVELSGAIADGTALVRTIHRFSEKSDLVAIVLRIESPGGAVAPSQEIFDAVRKASEKKPVVASIGTTAASGGFWVAMGADWIVASPGSLTGSIGVITELPDLRELARFAKIDMKVYKTGPHKDVGNPFREVTPGDEAIFMGMLSDIYDQFVEVVATRRHLDVDYVRRYADGRVFTGRQAKTLGFVDELGGLDAAARRAVWMAEERRAKEREKEPEHTKDDPTLVYPRKREPGILRLLAEEAGEGAASGATHAASSFFSRWWPSAGARVELR